MLRTPFEFMWSRDAGAKITKQHVIRLAEICFLALCFIALVLFVTGNSIGPQIGAHKVASGPATVWPGWPGIENIFVFGDSYSAQGFDCSSTQPSRANPFGNPDWSLVGIHSTLHRLTYLWYSRLPLASGSVWARFITLNYNQSFVRTWNLAQGGSVVDPSMTQPLPGLHGASLQSQLADKFKPTYAVNHGNVDWKPYNTMFALWFGINDILIPVSANQRPPIKSIMTSYRLMIEKLYNFGARNFLLINVPPVFRGHSKKKFVASETSDIQSWNRQLLDLRNSVVSERGDSTVFVFDAYSLWNDVLDDHTRFPATQDLQHLDRSCEKYSRGTNRHDQLDPQCNAPVNRYFWLNNLHATYPVHNATAAKIVEDCFAHTEKMGYCH